jgi:hypothetical protein
VRQIATPNKTANPVTAGMSSILVGFRYQVQNRPEEIRQRHPFRFRQAFCHSQSVVLDYVPPPRSDQVGRLDKVWLR